MSTRYSTCDENASAMPPHDTLPHYVVSLAESAAADDADELFKKSVRPL